MERNKIKRNIRLTILSLCLALAMVFPSAAIASADSGADSAKETARFELQALISEAKGIPQSELDACPAKYVDQLIFSTEKAEGLASNPNASAGQMYVCGLELQVALDTLIIDFQYSTIPDMQNLVASGKLTYEKLTQMFLTRIDLYDLNTIQLNSVRTLNQAALDDARKCDAAFAADPAVAKGMFGIPVLIKDNVNVLGMPTTAGSVALADNYAPYDAPLVTYLKASGAIILGKANLTEFANYITNNMPAGFSSLGGQVRNPNRPIRLLGDSSTLSPSGSSAGSGAAAAAALAAITIGTETSGSILSPSGNNSIVGIKPTVGLISRYGVIPISSTQDTAGPMGRSVTDVAVLLNAIAGYDPNDSATDGIAAAGVTGVDYTQSLKLGDLAGKRIGLIGIPGSTSASYGPFQAALQALRDAGAEIVTKPNGTALTYYNPSNPNSNPSSPSTVVLDYDFKKDLTAYLATLDESYPIKTLQDIVNFNNAYAPSHPGSFPYGQVIMIRCAALDLVAQKDRYEADLLRDKAYSQTNGIDYVLKEYNLDGLIGTGGNITAIGAKAGYPTVSIPLINPGRTTAPTNITFTGTAYTEAQQLEFAYVVEQATKYRVPPGMADKARLQVAIGAAQALSASGRAPFQAAYDSSLNAYHDNFLPQIGIDKADAALRGAFLAVYPADKAQLSEAVGFAAQINPSFLDQAIREEFLALFDTAASVNADGLSLPGEVSAAYNALNAAINEYAVFFGIHAAPVSYIDGDAEFVLSVENTINLLTVNLMFEIDGDMLSGKGLVGQSGFESMNGILWVYAGDGKWCGTVTLALPSGTTTGLTTKTPVDIAKFIFAPKGFGNAAVTLTFAEAVGLDDTTTYIPSIIKNGTAVTTIARSKYDLNRDGTVDALDLGIMLLYCGFDSDSLDWGSLTKVNDAWGNPVTASMCDVNGDGLIDMLDLLDLFIHYTK
ncbi:MAG: amidase family protein [Clostridiales bacterium]|nr:amidase family protein [Clostridiales bacterium]